MRVDEASHRCSLSATEFSLGEIEDEEAKVEVLWWFDNFLRGSQSSSFLGCKFVGDGSEWPEWRRQWERVLSLWEWSPQAS